MVPQARTPLARIGTTTHSAISAIRRGQRSIPIFAASTPSVTIATTNCTPAQAAATSNRPAGVSMNTPSICASIPLRWVSAMTISAVSICNGGTISSPNGTRNTAKASGNSSTAPARGPSSVRVAACNSITAPACATILSEISDPTSQTASAPSIRTSPGHQPRGSICVSAARRFHTSQPMIGGTNRMC